MVRFVQVGGLASIIAVASRAEPQPETGIPREFLPSNSGTWNPPINAGQWNPKPEGVLPGPEGHVAGASIGYIGNPNFQPIAVHNTPRMFNPVPIVGLTSAALTPAVPQMYQPYVAPNYAPISSKPFLNANYNFASKPEQGAVTFSPGNAHQARPSNQAPSFQAPTRYQPGGIRVTAPENNANKNDMEHAQMINLGNPGVVQGTDVIKSIAYRADGNYKLEINFKGVIPLTFVNLVAGKCSQFTPGVSIVNKDNIDTSLEIDLSICQKECDLANDDLLSSIDVLNQPIDISFGIQDPDDFNRIIGQYNIRPNPMYHEDYILEFNTKTEDTRQLVIDQSGNFFQVDDNIQFSFMTFTDDNYDVKTYSTKASAPPGHVTYLEMCPTNGFTVGKMQNVPEICFIKDLTNDKTVMMWDMGVSDGCIKDLRYHPDTGNWQYPANYYHIMGYSTHNTHHNDFKITCNMRVCGNIAGNPCQAQIEHCDYVV